MSKQLDLEAYRRVAAEFRRAFGDTHRQLARHLRDWASDAELFSEQYVDIPPQLVARWLQENEQHLDEATTVLLGAVGSLTRRLRDADTLRDIRLVGVEREWRERVYSLLQLTADLLGCEKELKRATRRGMLQLLSDPLYQRYAAQVLQKPLNDQTRRRFRDTCAQVEGALLRARQRAGQI